MVYKKFHVILFGLDILMDDTREIVMYPKGHQISSFDIGLVIVEDLWDVEEVSKFGCQATLLCQKHISKYVYCIGSKKKDSIEDNKLLQEIKKQRTHKITIPLDPATSDSSISYDEGSRKLIFGGSILLMGSRYKSEY